MHSCELVAGGGMGWWQGGGMGWCQEVVWAGGRRWYGLVARGGMGWWLYTVHVYIGTVTVK